MAIRSVMSVGALVCTAALFAACSGNDKKDAGPATTLQTGDAASTITTANANDSSSIASPKPCPFISEAQASELFGHPAKGGAQGPSRNGQGACLWESPAGREVFLTWIDGAHSNTVTYNVQGGNGLAAAQKDQLIALVKQAANS